MVMVKMRLGGASNRSLKNIIRKSREDLDALRRSGVGGLGRWRGRTSARLGSFEATGFRFQGRFRFVASCRQNSACCGELELELATLRSLRWQNVR